MGLHFHIAGGPVPCTGAWGTKQCRYWKHAQCRGQIAVLSSPCPFQPRHQFPWWTSRREGQGLSCCHAPPNGGAICRECRPPTMCEQVLHSPARWGSKTAGAPRTQDTCVAAQTTASQHSKTGGGQARSSNSSQPSLGMCSHRPLSSSPSPWAGRPHHRSYQYILSGYMYG